MREVYVEALAEGHALTDEELSASLASTLHRKPKGAGWWVFAYGSLLWNPLFPFAEARRASVHGLHRRFCLWSLASRGKPHAPGLVLGLDRGGSCRGVVYRLPSPSAMAEFRPSSMLGMNCPGTPSLTIFLSKTLPYPLSFGSISRMTRANSPVAPVSFLWV